MTRQERVSSGESIPLSDMFVALRRANRSLTHLYDLVLSPTGLKATQVAILQFIKQCDEVAQWRLAEEFCLSEASLSRRLTTLRAAGLVAQRIGNGGHKERLYRLTESGVWKCEQVRPYWNRAQSRLHRSFGTPEWESLLQTIAQLGERARNAELIRCANSELIKWPTIADDNPKTSK